MFGVRGGFLGCVCSSLSALVFCVLVLFFFMYGFREREGVEFSVVFFLFFVFFLGEFERWNVRDRTHGVSVIMYHNTFIICQFPQRLYKKLPSEANTPKTR